MDDQPIVMVDDDPDTIEIAEEVHSQSEILRPLLFFEGGAEFLAYMQEVEAKETPMPRVVLLDVSMPRPNGFDVLDTLRNNPAFEKIPIVIMHSHSDNPDDQQRARELGANDFQIKHFQIDDYINFFVGLDDRVSKLAQFGT